MEISGPEFVTFAASQPIKCEFEKLHSLSHGVGQELDVGEVVVDLCAHPAPELTVVSKDRDLDAIVGDK